MINGHSSPITVPSNPQWDELENSLKPVVKDLTPLEKFHKSLLDQSKNYPDPVPILNLIQGNNRYPLLTRKSFTLWQGKQKSKKTTALAMAVAVIIGFVISNEEIRFEPVEQGVVLFFDCEQGESYAARTMKLILKLADVETSDNLKYSDLREFSPTERLDIIKAAVEHTPNTLMVVVDGVVDLMNDFMDSKEGHTTVTELLKLSSLFDIHVAGVLHQNKGASKDARAHVGSISSQKCEREIMVEVDQDDRAQSIVICKESRGIPFDDFAIRWDKGALPCIVQDMSVSQTQHSQVSKKSTEPSDLDELTHSDILSTVFSHLKEPTYKQLLDVLLVVLPEKGFDWKKTKAERLITWYKVNNKIITNGKDGTRYVAYLLP